MACSGDSNILLCLGFFLIASCLCIQLPKLRALDKLRVNWTLNHGLIQSHELHHGRLIIGQNSSQAAKFKGSKAKKNLLEVDADYQADIGWGQPRQPEGQHGGFSKQQNDAAVERILKMDPKVECTGDSMKLKVHDTVSTPGSLFFVDRGRHLSPLPLSKLPPSCGYTIKSTQRDLVLVAPYDGCFVSLEEDYYVLPLLWLGLPVRMSCPLMRQPSANPPTVTCHTEGMVVKMEWTVSVTKIKVNLNGTWEPLMKAAHECGFSVVEHPEGVVVSVRYTSCLEKRDGMYILQLAGDGETKISCPSLSPAHPEPAQSQAKDFSKEDPVKQSASHPKDPQPPASEVPQVDPRPLYPEQPVQRKPHVPWGPQEHVYQPHYPYHLPQGFYEMPMPPSETPTQLPKESKPEAPENVSPCKASQGQLHQPFYPFCPPEPKPENEPAEKPTAAPWPEAPQGQVHQPFYPFYLPQPKPEKPTAVPQPPQPEAPQGQVHQPFYPFYLPQPKPEKPTAVPQPPQPEAPQGQVHQPFYPFYLPQPKPEKPTAVAQPPQPEALQGQVYKPFYPFYPLQPKPENEPAEKPTAAPQAEAHQGQVHQPFYPFYFPQPKPEKPTAASQPGAPQAQVYKPFYPFYPQQPKPESEPAEKPTAAPQPEAPQGQVQKPFYPFYPPQPKPENEPAEKPTAAPQHEVPQAQVYQPFYPFYPPQPKPENEPAEKPTAAPQPEAPQAQVYQPFYPFYPPQPKPENEPAEKPTAAPQPEAPQAQVYQPFYPFYPPQPKPENEPAEKPTAAPQPEAPQAQVYQPFYPFYPPQPKPENEPAEKPTAAPQPEAPQAQVYQPFYPFYPPQPKPENEPGEKPTAAPQPPQSEAPQGPVQQPFYPFYPPQPKPGNEHPEKPTAAPQPEAPKSQVYLPFYPFYPPQPKPEKSTVVIKSPATEIPKVQVHKPSYPQPCKMPGSEIRCDEVPTEKPVQREKPSTKTPEGPVPHPFYPYQYSQQPQPILLPFATNMQPQQVGTSISGQNPLESSILQPNNGVQQSPSYMPPLYCSCPSGFANCCPQIAFHQHHHHIVPAGPGNKDVPQIYTGLLFSPSETYYGFGKGFGLSPFPQKPNEASTSAPTSPQSPPSGNDKQPYIQPPDGNPAALPGRNPIKPTNPEQMYPYFGSYSVHPYWLYQPQAEELLNLQQRKSRAPNSVLSETLAPGNKPMEPYIIQSPKQQNGQSGDMNYASAPNFISQTLQQPHTAMHQNKHINMDLQPSDTESGGSKGSRNPKAKNEHDRPLLPYMLQDAQAPTYNKSVVANNSPQQFVNGSKKRHNVTAYSKPKSYVLLQHGPPNSFNESQLPFRHAVRDANFMAQNIARHQSTHQHPKNFSPPQEKLKHPKWLKGISSSLHGLNQQEDGNRTQK